VVLESAASSFSEGGGGEGGGGGERESKGEGLREGVPECLERGESIESGGNKCRDRQQGEKQRERERERDRDSDRDRDRERPNVETADVHLEHRFPVSATVVNSWRRHKFSKVLNRMPLYGQCTRKLTF
jgi:hypothetical protein